MEEEYVTIIEAARRIGMSDKTVRRAIHDGKLAARYPQPNKAEVSITDLEAWHATLHIRPGETQDRLKALETEVAELRARVEQLESKKKREPKTEEAPPEGFVWLTDFARQHFVPYAEAERLFGMGMIKGQPIKVKGRLHPMIGPRGQHDFYVQLHTRPDFRSCDQCPHIAEGSL
jgi:excisionase family DNA binding protein